MKKCRMPNFRWIDRIFHDMNKASVIKFCMKAKDRDLWWRIIEVAKAY